MLPTLGALVDQFAAATASILAGSARMFALLSVFPLFHWAKIPRHMTLGVALALAAPVWAGSVWAGSTGLSFPAEGAALRLAALVAKEAGIGILVGVVVSLPFWTVQAAGDIIDLYRGASLADIVNPFNQDANSILGPILFLLAGMTFVTTDGLGALLDLLYASFEAWPVADLVPRRIPDGVAAEIGGILRVMVLTAFSVASPVLLLLGGAELALVFVSKGPRQLPIDNLTVAIKNLLVILAMPVFVIFLQAYIRADWSFYVARLRALAGLP
jgi:type III secretion protein T